jgi:hypothetical protein
MNNLNQFPLCSYVFSDFEPFSPLRLVCLSFLYYIMNRKRTICIVLEDPEDCSYVIEPFAAVLGNKVTDRIIPLHMHPYSSPSAKFILNAAAGICYLPISGTWPNFRRNINEGTD